MPAAKYQFRRNHPIGLSLSKRRDLCISMIYSMAVRISDISSASNFKSEMYILDGGGTGGDAGASLTSGGLSSVMSVAASVVVAIGGGSSLAQRGSGRDDVCVGSKGAGEISCPCGSTS